MPNAPAYTRTHPHTANYQGVTIKIKTNFSQVSQIKETNFIQGEICPMVHLSEFETTSHLMHLLLSEIWIPSTSHKG